jgi:hypothetical protein
MPYKHPILGVQCMTLGEYCAEEIARTGKNPIEEAFQSMDEDALRAEEQFRNPDDALEVFLEYSKMERQYCEFDPGQEPPWPLMVKEVLESKFSQTFGGSTQHLVAIILCSDGKFHKGRLHIQEWSGSYMEPPDGDWELEWDPKDDVKGN